MSTNIYISSEANFNIHLIYRDTDDRTGYTWQHLESLSQHDFSLDFIYMDRCGPANQE